MTTQVKMPYHRFSWFTPNGIRTSMENFFSIEALILLSVAVLALVALIRTKPSQNAFFLMAQSALIIVYLLIGQKISNLNLSIFTLLFIFSLIILAANFYIEKSTQITTSRPSKINAIIGAIIFLVFFVNISKFKHENVVDIKIDYSLFSQDFSALIFAIFTLFAMLISAFLIINTKSYD